MNVLAFCPVDFYHFFPFKMREFGRKVLRKLKKQKMTQNIFFQVFSANTVCLSQIVDLIDTEKEFQNEYKVAGIIFDSSPRKITSQMAYQSLVEVNSSELFKGTVWFTCVLYGSIVNVKELDREFQKRLEKVEKYPKLYLSSQNDTLIPFPCVLPFIERQFFLNPNNPIFYKVWNDSKHVAHFMIHQKEYLNLVFHFLRFSLLFLDKKNRNLNNIPKIETTGLVPTQLIDENFDLNSFKYFPSKIHSKI